MKILSNLFPQAENVILRRNALRCFAKITFP